MRKDQDEDSKVNLEHDVNLLVSETQSSEEHRGTHVEEHTTANAQSSFAFHCQGRQLQKQDDKLRACCCCCC